MTIYSRYGWFWVWMIVVTAFLACLYYFSADTIDSVAGSIPVLKDIRTTIVGADTILKYTILGIGLVLVWWRVFKVVALQGSPFRVGLKMTVANQSENGRPVTTTFIGDAGDGGKLLFASIFRSHIRSDKLVRARLEFLTLTLSPKSSLVVQESRVSLKLNDSHEARIERLYSVLKRYAATADELRPFG